MDVVKRLFWVVIHFVLLYETLGNFTVGLGSRVVRMSADEVTVSCLG